MAGLPAKSQHQVRLWASGPSPTNPIGAPGAALEWKIQKRGSYNHADGEAHGAMGAGEHGALPF